MAEPFSIATGAFSVVSLAIQIASSIKTLKNFLDIVKEAPAEVRLALEEVEVLALVLDDIEQSVNDQTQSSPGLRLAVAKAAKLCQLGGDALKTLAEELSSSLMKRKRLAGFKAALRRDELLRFEARLERAKTTLLLANQCYNYALQRDSMNAQSRDISKLSVAISSWTEIRSTVLSPSRKTACWEAGPKTSQIHHAIAQEPVIFDTTKSKTESPGAKGLARFETHRYSTTAFFGSLQVIKHVKRNDGSDPASSTSGMGWGSEEVSITVQLPTWLLLQRYQIRLRRAYSGWDCSFRAQNVLPHDDPVWHLCVQGDIEGLQSRFSSRKASPFVSDNNGFTLLHYAAYYGRSQIMRFLIQCKADANTRSNVKWNWIGFFPFGSIYCTPLHIFVNGGGVLTFHDRTLSDIEYQDTLRLLVEEGDCDPSEPDGRQQDSLQLYHGPTSGFSWLVSKHDGGASYPRETPLWSDRFRSAWPNALELIREALPNSLISPAVAREVDDGGRTFLHRLIRWGISYRVGANLEAEWQQFVREAIQAGADVHAQCPEGLTPFLIVLRNQEEWRAESGEWRQWYSRRAMRKTIAQWLKILKELGFDLRAYAEREVHLWDTDLLRSWGGINQVEIRTGEWIAVRWDEMRDPLSCHDEFPFTAGCEIPLKKNGHGHYYSPLKDFFRLTFSELNPHHEDNALSYNDSDDDGCSESFNGWSDEDGSDDGEVLQRIPGSWD